MKRAVSLAVLGVIAVAGPAFADPVADACMSRTLYSDATCGCVAEEAAALSVGQYALLVAVVDADGNITSTYRDAGLNLADAARVNGFIWTTAPSCIAEGH